MNEATSQALIPLIYEAALDADKWAEFCNTYFELLDSPVQVMGFDLRNQQGLEVFDAGYSQSCNSQYNDHFAAINPWMHLNMVMPVGQVMHSDQALARKKLFRTEFYNDWLKPQGGLIGGNGVIVYRKEGVLVAMTSAVSARNEGKRAPETAKMVKMLSPHLCRSITLSRSLARERDFSESTLPDQLFGARYGVFAVRSSGRTAWHNNAAQSLLQHGSVLRTDFNGKLLGANGIGGWLEKCRKLPTEDFCLSTAGPIMTKCKRFGPLAFHWHPLDRTKGVNSLPFTAWSDPVVGLLVACGKDGLNETGRIKRVVVAIGATPAEADLAQALVEGTSIYEFAESRELSRHTVRNQMRKLLAKADVGSQQEFIALVLRLESPFTSN